MFLFPGGSTVAVTPALVNFESSGITGTDSTTINTFSSLAIGTAAADRVNIVGVGGADGSRTVSSLSVSGISATKLVAQYQVNTEASIWAVAVSSGTTANVVVTWSGANHGCGVSVWSATGTTTTAHATASSGTSTNATRNTTISCPAGGFIVGYGGVGDAGQQYGSGVHTWTNLTEVMDVQDNVSQWGSHSSASDNFSDAQTDRSITLFDNLGTNWARQRILTLASFAPA